MAINCNIVYASDGSIEYINTESGQRSSLFDKLTQTLGGDKNSALTLYALTDSENFKAVYSKPIQVLSERIDIEDSRNRKGLVPIEQLEDFIGEDRLGEAQMTNSLENIKNLKASIKKEGFKQPILIVYDAFSGQGEASIVEGNHRIIAAKQLGYTEIPVIFEKGTIRKNEDRVKEGMHPLKRKEVGVIDTRFGIDGTKLGLSVRQPNKQDLKTTLLEPTVEDVMQYANSIDRELTAEQKIQLQDVIMSLGVDNSMEAEAILEDALVNNGIVVFDRAKMLNSGGFNEFEIMQILNSPQKQTEIKEILQALKNTDVVEIEYPKDFVYAQGTELNSFGKQTVKNPYVSQQEIIDNQELPDGIKEEYEALFEGVQSVSNKTVLDNQLVDKTDGSDTQIILEQTVTDDYNPSLSENLNFITEGFSISIWENNKEAVSEIVKQIKEDAKTNGIDLKNIEEKVFTKTRQELLDFFNAMEDLLENNNAEEFAVRYNIMFDLNTPTTTAIKTDNEFDIVLEENITEYEAFSKYNLLKKAPNIYRQIEDLDLENMYSITATNENKTVDEVKKEIQDNPLDLPDFEVDIDTLEKMQLYKNYFNFPREFTNIVEEKQDIDYIKKANKWLLKSENPYYKITRNGFELVSDDSITASRGEMTLPESLRIKVEEPVIVEDLNAEKRKEVLSNPMSVKKLGADYLYVNDNVVAVKNTPTDFIRTPKGIFEIIYEQDNISFYGKVESSDDKPLSNINFDNLKYLENTPDIFKKPKQYYTKTELEKINSEFFEC